MIRTTVIGSWPLPEMYRERLLQYHRGTLPEMLIKPTLVGAAEIAIREQKATGVTQFMGGEFFAEVFIQHLPRKLTGVKLVKPQAAELKAYTDLAEYELTDDIDAPHGLGYIEAFRRESQLEPTLEKASVPGPLEVLAHIRPTPEVQRQISRAIEIVNREIHGLAAAGAREIQLDIPYIAIRSVLGQLAPEEAVDLIARSFAGVEALKTIHCCLGDLGSQSAITVHNLHALLPYIERLRGVIDKVHLECSHAGQWADRACLRDIPKELQDKDTKKILARLDSSEFWIGYSNSLKFIRGYMLKQAALLQITQARLTKKTKQRDETIKVFCNFVGSADYSD